MTERPLTHHLRILMAIVSLSIATFSALAAEPKLIAGVFSRGHNITEPKPQKSRFLETIQGGVVVLDEIAGFFLTVRVTESPGESMYIRAEYEDPLGGPSKTNDQEFNPADKGFAFSSPAHVPGLKNYQDYMVTVSVYRHKSDAEPIDVLRQKIRSYVDTTGSEIKVFSRIRSTENAP